MKLILTVQGESTSRRLKYRGINLHELSCWLNLMAIVNENIKREQSADAHCDQTNTLLNRILLSYERKGLLVNCSYLLQL